MKTPRPWLRRLPAWFGFYAWLGLLAASSAFAQGTLVIDQQAGDFLPAGASIREYSPAQSFTPASYAVGYVQLVLTDLGSGAGAYVVLNLRSNAINGPLMGSTSPVFVASGASRVVTDMIFDSPVLVTPGTTYYFDVQIQSGNDIGVGGYNSFNYLGGQAYYNGTISEFNDLWFREGIIQPAPEPGTLALGVVGLGALAYARRRFRRP